MAVEGDIEAEVRYFLMVRAVYYLKIAAEIHISEEALRQVEHLFGEQIKDVAALEIQFLAAHLDLSIAAGHLKKTDTAMLAQHLVIMSEGIKKSVKERHIEPFDVEKMRTEIGENLDYILGLIWAGLRA